MVNMDYIRPLDPIEYDPHKTMHWYDFSTGVQKVTMPKPGRKELLDQKSRELDRKSWRLRR